MRYPNFTFRLIIFLLSVTILLTGCHSYYTISKDDYNKIKTMDDIKIVFKDGKEFVVEKDDSTNVQIVGDSVVVSQGAEIKFIQLSEVEKIKEDRFDLGGTITVVMIPLIILVASFFASYTGH